MNTWIVLLSLPLWASGFTIKPFQGNYDVESLKEIVTNAGVQPVVGLCYPIPNDEGKKRLWTLEKICGSQNQVRIKNQATGEYLYPSTCDPCRDFGVRKVFTWANPSSIPDSHPDIWKTTADWVIGRDFSGGNTLKSVKHNELLFASSDRRSFSELDRSAYTKSIYSGLTRDGLWRFSKDINSFLASSKIRVLTDVEIINMGCDEYLKSGSISGSFGPVRRTVYTEKNHGTFRTVMAPSLQTITDNNGQVRTVNVYSQQQERIFQNAPGPDSNPGPLDGDDTIDVYDVGDGWSKSEYPDTGLQLQVSNPTLPDEID